MTTKLTETVAARAARSLNKPVIVLAIRGNPDGSFSTEYAIHGMTRPEVEACAIDLLRAIVADISGCPDCAACQAREARASAALEALTKGRTDIIDDRTVN